MTSKARVVLRSTVLLCAVLALAVTSYGAPPVPVAGDKPSSADPQLLLLKNGRVVEGRISSTAGGYFVETSSGNMVVPFPQVSLEAVDLVDAYEKQRKSMKFPTASMHLALAAWCLNHHLLEQARTEARDALRLEPNRPQARRMLVRIEQAIDPKSVSFSEKPQEDAAPKVVAGYELPPVQTLAALPREAARDFTRRVQPLLLNKCGACHGENTEREFRLFPVRRRGQSRINSQRNLASILDQIDGGDPDGSPLLEQPQGVHGGLPRPLFYGAHGKKQLAVLRDWVRQVAASDADILPTSKRQESPSKNEAPTASERLIPVVVSQDRAFPEVPPERQPLDGETSESNSTADSDEESIREVLRRPPADAFDPSEFNRRAGSG